MGAARVVAGAARDGDVRGVGVDDAVAAAWDDGRTGVKARRRRAIWRLMGARAYQAIEPAPKRSPTPSTR